MRYLKWAGAIVAVLFVGLTLFVAFGLNTLRGPISDAVSRATGRELRIEGDLRAVWDWRHPRFRAEKVTLANPAWASEATMFYADAVEASVSVLPLFIGRVVIPEAHLEGPEVNLERDAEGRRNWLFEKDEKKEGGSRIFIRALTLDEGVLRYAEPGREIDIAAELSSHEKGISFEASGTYKGLDAHALGEGGPVLGLRDTVNPYPLKADAKIGETAIIVDGSVTGIVELAALDLKIDLRGESMSQLYDIFGIAFPETSPYTTTGRLVREDKVIRYQDFKGRVGESDLAGTFQVDTGGNRPFMQGDLVSKVLNFADLGPLVGTDQPAASGVLPDSPFDPARWDSVDADVKLRTGTIKRPKQLPLENLSTRIQMRDKVLSLDPLEFGIAGGKLIGPIVLDGRTDTIKGDLKLRVQKLSLAKLFPTLKEGQASVGALSGLIELKGTGNSVAKLLGTADGKLGVYMDGGKVSRYLMELAALDLWDVAALKLKGDESIEVRCGIADFGVKQGVAHANALVFDTAVVNIQGEGTINLRTEEMNLKLVPKPKDRSLASLNSPLLIRGTFGAPKVAPDMEKLARRGLGALVMGIINPLLAVLPLLKDAEGEDSNCGQLLAQATTSSRSAATGASKPAAQKAPARRAPQEKAPAPKK